ncbi:hypothetical protein FOXG_21673 [Fusarium oxysporum f. sp. lycopersici 4287]|uniref:Uncharacterized protein n=1 Tax=Fusarium oxysporum f. sp. lycopersici (strain 4287 / CBS 123668 / FGSC 9935 / NRRL 34936) TaxID=426428 RepID=A0A0J9WTQ9_FUSO4|nr:hypothetical protein FOXG_21673 [Fusarium oxysporum f. sp. lycopersici 4287]KNB16462.1 hypothetical protein FOXG_21673 [Fusarium oxysporum f. sp. lycopersici 4287]
MAVPTRSTQRQTATGSTIPAKKDVHLPDSVDALSFTQTRKRKAECSLPNPPKQRHASCNDRPRIPRGFQVPSQVPKGNDNAGEEHVTSFLNLRPSTLSLQDLIRWHRQRLYVHPLRWTSQHLDFLACQFVDQSQVARVPLTDVTNRNLQKSLRTQRNAQSRNIKNALASLRSHSNNDKLRCWAIEDLMAAYGFRHQTGPNSREDDAVLLRFGPHEEVSLQVDVFLRSHTVVAYLDFDHIASLRVDTVYTTAYRRLFQIWPNNEPVKAILEAKLRQIQPVTQQHDPFILAVLVALAQEKRRSCPMHNATEASTSTPELDSRTKLSHTTDPIASFTQVHVLATSTCELTRLWAFTARFPRVISKQVRLSVTSIPC